MKKPSHTTVVAYLALFFAMTGTAAAATGGTFLLGRANYEGRPATLKNTTSGEPALSLLTAKNNVRPFSVGTNRTKVPYLNADLLDGLHASSFLRAGAEAKNSNLLDGIDSTQFQRRVGGVCGAGSAIQSIGADGTVACQTVGVTPHYVVVAAAMSSGVGVATCPTGTTAISGGVEPDFGNSTTGFSDPVIFVDGPGFDSSTNQSSWLGAAKDDGGSALAYNGGGNVYAYCVPTFQASGSAALTRFMYSSNSLR